MDEINPQAWRTSTRCETAACVAVAVGRRQVRMRDTADPAGPVLTFGADTWTAFLDGIRAGDFT